MEINQTDNQQVEEIKQFLKRYSGLFLTVFLLGLLVVAGVRYWQYHGALQDQQASTLYQELLVADAKKDPQSAQVKAQTLITQYAKTPYAQFAALNLAKIAVDAKDYKSAEDHLRWVLSQNKFKKITGHIATERLARIMLQRGEYDAGLKLLSESKPDKAYISLFEEARGDLYLAKGDIAQTKTSYLKAMQDLPSGAQAPILQLKLLDLGVGTEHA